MRSEIHCDSYSPVHILRPPRHDVLVPTLLVVVDERAIVLQAGRSEHVPTGTVIISYTHGGSVSEQLA